MGCNSLRMGDMIMSKTAIVFAGQGAQAVGMGKDLADAYPECAALYKKADDVLGTSISRLCFEGPIEELTKSNNCQPAIFVTSIACLKALEKETAGKLSIAGTAGLSLGEWSALCMAGVISFEDGLRVMQARGQYMQDACQENAGGMVSIIGLGADKLKEVCAATGVEMANINSPEQIVLSGDKDRIKQAEAAAIAAGAKKAIVLNVAGAFHSKLMSSAAVKLEKFLGGITMNVPNIPVISNFTGKPHGSPDEIRKAMVSQVTGSVQWVSTIEWFRLAGVTRYVEAGPGKVLSGLIKRIDKAAATNNVQDAASVKETAAAMTAV